MANTGPRYLTKSRFKLGMECPTKLFYTKKDEYPDKKLDDSFLEALAEGGFQVGELAKSYHPGGHDITSLDYTEAEKQTLELLKQDKVIIYEPAIRYKNLFIRIDILVKNGANFELVEVKAKSFNADDDEDSFYTDKGTIRASWRPYLEDVAFQRFVLSKAFPKTKIKSYLMLADKNVPCPVDGLNQKLRIVRAPKDRMGVKVSNSLDKEDLKEKILTKVLIDDEIDFIGADGAFFKSVETLARAYEENKRLPQEIGAKCADCEFRCTKEEEAKGKKDGFKECWKNALEWTDEDFEEPNVLELWNSRKKDHFISVGRVKLMDIHEDDIAPEPDGKPGLTAKERQWMQVDKVQQGDDEYYFESAALKLEMDKWVYPLHLIDFETSMVAVPFKKGRRPYEAIAFQFSHHVLHKDGKVEHAGEYLNAQAGEFPNYDFVRELKKQLSKDAGTILRYSPHENTCLNHIYRQLKEDKAEIKDREELCEFIKSITNSSSSSAEKWFGKRSMVDLWQLVKRFYYDPKTRGSNSIKAVLPAILNSSQFLQKKYGQKNYNSANFKDWQWLEMKDGEVIDPYKKLPKLFQDVTDKNFELLSREDELSNGGAALTAYAKMQFGQMNESERKELSAALKRYCELDTLAMVMILEAWRDWIKR